MLRWAARRFYATSTSQVKKRFYKNVSLLNVGQEGIEIHLDGRTVKTPKGRVFRINNEPLAVAIAQEWDCQKDWIRPNRMHLTGLAMTALDNPTSHTKERFMDDILNVFQTDTIFFLTDESDALARLQSKHWGELIEWAKTYLAVDVKPSSSIIGPEITDETKQRLLRFLAIYNIFALRGVSFAVDALKSVILALACIQGRLAVEEAVKLSMLEQEYQIQRWGRVEWAHDVEYFDSCARLAAAVLFVQLNSTSHSVVDVV